MRVGDEVISRYGDKGKIESVYAHFDVIAQSLVTTTPQEWLDQQEVPFTIEYVVITSQQTPEEGGGVGHKVRVAVKDIGLTFPPRKGENRR